MFNITDLIVVVTSVFCLLATAESQEYSGEKYKLDAHKDTIWTKGIPVEYSDFPEAEKIAIAVMELDANGVTSVEAKALTDRLRIELFNAGIFQVMERDKMNRILDEMQFQMSGCTSDECVVEVGKIVGVKKIIAGSVSKVGEIYSVSIRLIDVETSRIEATAIEDIEGALGAVLTEAIPSVARQISGLERQTKELKGKKTAFKISTEPYGASVFIDDVYYGIAPIEVEVVPSVTHRLTIVNEGYDKWEHYYDIKKDQVLEINVALSKKSQPVTKNVAEKPKRQFKTGFKIRYSDFHIVDKINNQVQIMNAKMAEGNELFHRRQPGAYVFDEINNFSGIELSNLRQSDEVVGFDFGLGIYRSSFTQWIKNFDATYSEPTLIFWMPSVNLNLRLAPIRFPLFYPFCNVGFGYDVLIIDAVEDNKSMGSPIFHSWGLMYGVGAELRLFKFIGLACDWNHYNMKYKLMNIENKATQRFKDASISQMDLSGNTVGLSLNLYY